MGIMSSFQLEFLFGTIYFSLSLTLNVALTMSIVLRLWYCRSQTQTALGKGYGRHFTFLAILFIESAFPNALCSILLVVANVKVTNSQPECIGECHRYDDTYFALWDSMFQVMLALTPPIQVCYILLNSMLRLMTYVNLPGTLKLLDHIPGDPRTYGKLEQ